MRTMDFPHMDTPMEILAEVPLPTGIPMEVRFPRGCPWRTRRGRPGHGAAQGAGLALAPSSPRGTSDELQPNPDCISDEIPVPIRDSHRNLCGYYSHARFACSSGDLHEDPNGKPHGVSAWTMDSPEEMAMEIPVEILIPMQIRIHEGSIPTEMRRGRQGHGAVQGAGPALAPSSPRGNPAGLQQIPMGNSMGIPTGGPWTFHVAYTGRVCL